MLLGLRLYRLRLTPVRLILALPSHSFRSRRFLPTPLLGRGRFLLLAAALFLSGGRFLFLPAALLGSGRLFLLPATLLHGRVFTLGPLFHVSDFLDFLTLRPYIGRHIYPMVLRQYRHRHELSLLGLFPCGLRGFLPTAPFGSRVRRHGADPTPTLLQHPRPTSTLRRRIHRNRRNPTALPRLFLPTTPLRSSIRRHGANATPTLLQHPRPT
ncbi:hypothetical protein ACFU9Y_40455, partial [Streptomyces sp. NPDC057621]|uniref:hypothetical protein n=1 Tax=Streptomyces sp. NPDC057621 TaxID=3346186 RepID=UPI003682B7C5